MIEARELHVRIGAQALLAGVSLELCAGELVAVVGPNGAGKSTLRRVLCGDAEPNAGEVWMDGRPLAAWPLVERARVRAVLPQDSTLNFPFTVLEVVLMGRTPHVRGTEEPRDYEIARAALNATEAEHLSERVYPTLSGGERQRVQLARVLAQIWEPTPTGDARYLLLDEPTSNLDLAHQHSTLNIARRFTRTGLGALVILHDLNLAAQYADRLIMLKAGRVVAAGPPAQVLTESSIRATFDVPVLITRHPVLDCPLVVPTPGLH